MTRHTPSLLLNFAEKKGERTLINVDASQFGTERSAVRAAGKFMKENGINFLWVKYGEKGTVRIASITEAPVNVDHYAKILFARGNVFSQQDLARDEKGVTPLKLGGWWAEAPAEENVTLRKAAYDAGRIARRVKGKVSFTFNKVALTVDPKDAPQRTLSRYKKAVAPKP